MSHQDSSELTHFNGYFEIHDNKIKMMKRYSGAHKMMLSSSFKPAEVGNEVWALIDQTCGYAVDSAWVLGI